jgi:hypothetical protein
VKIFIASFFYLLHLEKVFSRRNNFHPLFIFHTLRRKKMLRKINKWILAVAGMLILCTLFFASQKSLMQKQPIKEVKTDESIPEGNWAVSFHPYLKDDYIDSPVVVTSVTNKDAAITSFTVFNNSDKDVKSLRVKWLLYTDENRQKVVMEGKSPLLRFFDNLVAGKGGRIKYSATSLRNFYPSFVGNGKLNGDFLVDLMVDEVKFTDSSGWKITDGKVNYANAKFEKKAKLLTPCSMQTCKSTPNTDIKGGVTYICGSSQVRETCSNSQDQLSCTTSACDRMGGGGGGDLDFEMIQQ